MSPATLIFRLRVWFILALYLLGFFAPWEPLWRAPGTRSGTLWLASSTLLGRTGWVGLATATVTVTCFALVCMIVGAILRVWGTSYLGASVMAGHAMQGNQVIAAGPYRSLRNPLYLGSWLFAVGVSFLMPPSGALFFIISMCLLMVLLIRGEEHFLSFTLGSTYEGYRRQVPRLLPRLRPTIPPSSLRPHWLQGLAAEVLVVSYTLCFAVLAWRYDVQILLRSLLICLSASFVLRGFQRGQNRRPSR